MHLHFLWNQSSIKMYSCLPGRCFRFLFNTLECFHPFVFHCGRCRSSSHGSTPISSLHSSAHPCASTLSAHYSSPSPAGAAHLPRDEVAAATAGTPIHLGRKHLFLKEWEKKIGMTLRKCLDKNKEVMTITQHILQIAWGPFSQKVTSLSLAIPFKEPVTKSNFITSTI